MTSIKKDPRCKPDTSETRYVGFDPSQYEPWIPNASGVDLQSCTIPLYVRRFQGEFGKADAQLFLDRLTTVHLELAQVLAVASGQQKTTEPLSCSVDAAS